MKVKKEGHKAIITLGRQERPLWSARGGSGPDVYETRKRVKDKVLELLSRGFMSVDVYAPAEAGGWMVDQWAQQ